MDAQESEILELLKQPITIDCYMISKEWWKQWIAFSKSTNREIDKPGVIYNVELVYFFALI